MVKHLVLPLSLAHRIYSLSLVHGSVFILCYSLLSFQYKFRDLTVEELKTVNMSFPHFKYSMDTYGMSGIL